MFLTCLSFNFFACVISLALFIYFVYISAAVDEATPSYVYAVVVVVVIFVIVAAAAYFYKRRRDVRKHRPVQVRVTLTESPYSPQNGKKGIN